MLKDYFEVPNKPAIKSGNILSCDFTDHETFIPQPLDYSRGTLATYVDCNGFIKMSGVSDTELVTNGNFDNGSTSWTLIGDASIGNGVCTFFDTGSNTNSQLISQIGILANKTYKLVFDVTRYVAGSIQIIFGGATAVSVNITEGVGTYTVYVVNGPSTSWLIKRNGGYPGFDFDIDNISLKQVDLNTPRIDYTTEIGKAKELQKPSLLLEPQSTNLIPFSEDFSNSYWTKTNCTVQKSTIKSPDGLQSSYKLIPDAGTGGNRSLGRSFSGLSNFHTFSVLAKAGEYKYAVLRTRNNPNVVVAFDLENGTFNINQSSAIYIADSAKIENYGNGWYRCSITLDPSQADNAGQLFPSVSVGITGNEINNFDGDGTSGIYVFGAQFEQQSYSTSYIPTSGFTVTRNQDTAKNAGSKPVFNSEEGVLYAETAALVNGGSTRAISIFSAGDNRITLTLHSTVNRVQFYIAMNGFVNTVDLDATDIIQTNMNKIACKFKANDYALWINGIEKDTNTTQSNTVQSGTLNSLNFDINGSNNFYGKVKEVKVFRRALTDAELTELTNNIV